jgi:predicted DNA-binding transcriptional regulator AlpA
MAIAALVQAKKRHYVYTLAYPDGTVFYIGKGSGYRILQHEYDASKGYDFHNNPKKCSVIRDIWKQGEQVQKNVVFETDVERDAIIYEWALINMVYQDGLTNGHTAGKLMLIEAPARPPKVVTVPTDLPYEEDGEVFLTVKETCARLDISRQALDGYVERGQLTKYRRTLARRVFFKQSEVDKLLKIEPESHKDN